MRKFKYTVTDPVGIHARPASILTREAKRYESAITIHKGDRSTNVKKIMGLMALGVACGDTITVRRGEKQLQLLRLREGGLFGRIREKLL